MIPGPLKVYLRVALSYTLRRAHLPSEIGKFKADQQHLRNFPHCPHSKKYPQRMDYKLCFCNQCTI